MQTSFKRKQTITSENNNMMLGNANRIGSGGAIKSVLKVGSGQTVRNSDEDSSEF